ncbi:MAG TPA: hypothetical protein VNZ67_05325, partial [bacterium]|nr:hypothetical protein [bacterium]
ILFHEIFGKGQSRVNILATFLGMLELAKMRSVLIRQAALFGEIHIYKRPDSPAAPAAGAADPDETPGDAAPEQ